ncbi:hypothetical protein OG239_42030 (plasmid) [Streptomyces sp. NBC_00868]|uniref:hypothetical protein n=1 Tax=Streptomyces sp. NBC_00868 TaxID=2903683 RepID=UPI0038705A94|nr:hypothetical protein OG239_42030 [Streptomyces sp. NBC_00868]
MLRPHAPTRIPVTAGVGFTGSHHPRAPLGTPGQESPGSRRQPLQSADNPPPTGV